MRVSLRSLFGIGSSQKPTDPKAETSSDPRLSVIAAAAPDPDLATDDKSGSDQERAEGVADQAVARAETPFWMRHLFGPVNAEYRILIGLFAIILASIIGVSLIPGAHGIVSELFCLLQALLAGLIGGEIVKRSRDR